MPLIVIEHHHHYPNSEGSTLTSLLQNMMENIMAQLDDLMTILGTIHNDVTAVLDRAKTLTDQLTQLQQTTPPQVDLQPAIDAASAIRDQLEGTAAATGSASGATDANASTSDTTGGEAPADATNDPTATEQSPTPESAPADPAESTGDQTA